MNDGAERGFTLLEMLIAGAITVLISTMAYRFLGTVSEEAAYAESVYHLYVVRHPRRDELKKHLEANQIGCALHYPLPLHLQKCYASLGYHAGDFPVAEKAARECLSLPIYPELTDAQIRRVADVIQEFFKKS